MFGDCGRYWQGKSLGKSLGLHDSSEVGQGIRHAKYPWSSCSSAFFPSQSGTEGEAGDTATAAGHGAVGSAGQASTLDTKAFTTIPTPRPKWIVCCAGGGAKISLSRSRAADWRHAGIALARACSVTQPRLMKVTLDLPDEYAGHLPCKEAELAEVLSAGLRSWHGRKTCEVEELEDVVEMLAGLPSPEEVLALHPSARLAERTAALLEKNRDEGLTVEEQGEWERIMRGEHLVRVAKARALAKLKADGRAG